MIHGGGLLKHYLRWYVCTDARGHKWTPKQEFSIQIHRRFDLVFVYCVNAIFWLVWFIFVLFCFYFDESCEAQNNQLIKRLSTAQKPSVNIRIAMSYENYYMNIVQFVFVTIYNLQWAAVYRMPYIVYHSSQISDWMCFTYSFCSFVFVFFFFVFFVCRGFHTKIIIKIERKAHIKMITLQCILKWRR